MPREEKRSLVITTSGNRSVHDVANDLKDAGFEVEDVLEAINVVTGKASADQRDKLRSVNDVVDVSEDTPVDIGPPDAKIT